MESFGIESLDRCKDILRKGIDGFSGKNTNAIYSDMRLELSEGKGTSALNGNSKASAEDFNISIGLRVIARKNRGSLSAAGYYGSSLGGNDLKNLGRQMKKFLAVACRRALRNSAQKTRIKAKYPLLSSSLKDNSLAEIKAIVDSVKAEFRENPKDISLEELAKRVESCSKEISKIEGIATNSISASTGLERSLFVSSEGSLIDQSRALTEAFVYIAAKGKAVETYYEDLGRYAGLEVFDGMNSHKMSLEDFSEYLAKGTAEVSNAPAFCREEKNAKVITDPSYNALLCHEITGHPSEADRALKREAAWAGRAWWFRGIDDNEIGKSVASENVSVFSDPGLKDGYGHYKYDDEGVEAKKTMNIKEGILNEFLNSRETATILGKEPNGGMRASSASAVPIIRMNNTCFAKGDYSKDELFAETKDGYYAFGMKTPSIGETRQNFRISCWKLYKIENGEIKQLYRMGSIMADSYSFLKSIDAVADDFTLYNIPNCGKGTPIQVMKVGNGGPHMRGIAKICGANG